MAGGEVVDSASNHGIPKVAASNTQPAVDILRGRNSIAPAIMLRILNQKKKCLKA